MPPAFIEHSLGAKRVYNIIMAYQVGPTYHSPVANGRTDKHRSNQPSVLVHVTYVQNNPKKTRKNIDRLA